MSVVANNQAIPLEVTEWCARYSGFTLTLAEAFLIVSLLAAIVETAIMLWSKVVGARNAGGAEALAEKEGLAFDPAKVLEALKGVLEALKGLPVWIAMFLAGLALLWMAAQQPEGCPFGDREAAGNAAAGNTASSAATGNRTQNGGR